MTILDNLHEGGKGVAKWVFWGTVQRVTQRGGRQIMSQGGATAKPAIFNSYFHSPRIVSSPAPHPNPYHFLCIFFIWPIYFFSLLFCFYVRLWSHFIWAAILFHILFFASVGEQT